MARLLALNALFFATPFLAYAGWLVVTRGSVGDLRSWPTKVVLYLCLAGAVTMGLGLLALTSFSGARTDETYQPAVLRDGQIVPGGFRNDQR